MKVNFKILNQYKWLLASLAIIVLLLMVVWMWPSLTKAGAFFGDQEAISGLVRSYGIWGPLLLASLHFVQILIAVVPGTILIVASGYVYGFWGGFFLSLIITVGLSQAAFSLARWGGRPLVEKFVRPASLQRLDRFAGRYGVFFFMVCFMIPIFQADAMNYVAGLSSLSARKFFVANLLGRLPGVVVMTAIGAFGLALSPVVWIIFVVGGVILLAIGRLVLKKLDSESPDVDQG